MWKVVQANSTCAEACGDVSRSAGAAIFAAWLARRFGRGAVRFAHPPGTIHVYVNEDGYVQGNVTGYVREALESALTRPVAAIVTVAMDPKNNQVVKTLRKLRRVGVIRTLSEPEMRIVPKSRPPRYVKVIHFAMLLRVLPIKR
jgi:hypothetical protein